MTARRPRLRFRLSEGWIRRKGNGVRSARVWARLLGVEHTVVEAGRLRRGRRRSWCRCGRPAGRRRRCGVCRRRCPGYDQGEGRRRWRALDLGTVQAFLEAEAPRVRCRQPRGGRRRGAVGQARRRVHPRVRGHRRVAGGPHLQAAVAELLRVAWRTVGRIVARVAAERPTRRRPLAGLRRIGIDEISYRKGHRYLTVVVDHDTGRLVWAAPGRDEATLDRFFDALGEQRCAQLSWSAPTRPTGSPTRSPRRCPPGSAVPGPVPRRPLGHRRAGRGPPRGLERRPPGRRSRRWPESSRAPGSRCGRTPST